MTLHQPIYWYLHNTTKLLIFHKPIANTSLSINVCQVSLFSFSRPIGSSVWLQISLLLIALSVSSPALSPELCKSCLSRIFPCCFRSSSLPFPWHICPQHFPQNVFFISPHRMPVPVRSSLRDLFVSRCHSRCYSDVFVPDIVFVCHSAHPS